MEHPRRKNPRLDTWDYAAHAAYHVTFCTAHHSCTLGRVADAPDGSARVALTELGEAARDSIEAAEQDYPAVTVHASEVMPNHVHILAEVDGDGALLGSFVRKAKSRVTRWARRNSPDAVIWQRSYHDHIIRDEADFQRTLEYIANNPAKWREDKYHPATLNNETG